jgi:hypothetical protein
MRFDLTGVSLDTPVEPKAILAAGIDHPLCEGREAVGLLKAMMHEVSPAMNSIEKTLFV